MMIAREESYRLNSPSQSFFKIKDYSYKNKKNKAGNPSLRYGKGNAHSLALPTHKAIHGHTRTFLVGTGSSPPPEGPRYLTVISW